jgi:hypothetical protein
MSAAAIRQVPPMRSRSPPVSCGHRDWRFWRLPVPRPPFGATPLVVDDVDVDVGPGVLLAGDSHESVGHV